MTEPKVGQRIRLLARLHPLRAGLEGTVVATSFAGPKHLHMIYVRWDNGQRLAVLPYVDRFEVFDEPAACSKGGE